jgi:hypothetical protein
VAKLAGKGSRITIAATAVKCTRWSDTVTCQLLDATTTEGNGFGEVVAGVVDGEVNFDFVYDLAAGPMALFAPAAAVAFVSYPAAGTAGSNLAGTLVVGEFTKTGEARGLVTGRCSGKFTGTITGTSL